MSGLNGVSVTTLAASATITATGNGAAVDVGNYHGLCQLILASGAANAGTSVSKLQHSDDGSTGWTDVATATFAAVGTTASDQTVLFNADRFKKFVRVVDTLAGGANSVSRAVLLVGCKQYA